MLTVLQLLRLDWTRPLCECGMRDEGCVLRRVRYQLHPVSQCLDPHLGEHPGGVVADEAVFDPTPEVVIDQHDEYVLDLLYRNSSAIDCCAPSSSE